MVIQKWVTYPEMSVLSIYGFLTPYGGFYGYNIYTDMILDEYLSFEQKIYTFLIFSSLWIYFRTLGCYAALPRKSILSVFIVHSILLDVRKLLWAFINTNRFNYNVHVQHYSRNKSERNLIKRCPIYGGLYGYNIYGFLLQ